MPKPSREAARWSWMRHVVTLGVTALVVVLVASCDDGSRFRHQRGETCDYGVKRCRTVCDSWCDGWGYCYPSCWDQCWFDCQDGREPVADASTAVDAAPPSTTEDAGTSPSGGGTGALCASCDSNDDCASGALCILAGGPKDASTPDAGSGPGHAFCGRPCSIDNCPAGFICSAIGPTRQCLPTSGSCGD